MIGEAEKHPPPPPAVDDITVSPSDVTRARAHGRLKLRLKESMSPLSLSPSLLVTSCRSLLPSFVPFAVYPPHIFSPTQHSSNLSLSLFLPPPSPNNSLFVFPPSLPSSSPQVFQQGGGGESHIPGSLLD